jgi:Barrel-sandwich domain of CusB or HlyD membrane-fusion
MSLPDFHPGDQAQPGTPIARIVDPMEMNLVSHVSERDHSNVHAGQQAEVSFYSLPGKVFHGTVKNVAGMTAQPFFIDTNTRGNFDVTIELKDRDARLLPGLTAQIVFLGDSQKNVLWLPRLALFLKDGKRIVYVKKGNGYDQREVKIQSENESRAAIQGLTEGTEVALLDPTAPRKTSPAASSSDAGPRGTP